MDFAKQLVSAHVVTGFPEQRLSYLSEEIQRVSAHYCAVLRPRSYALIGLVRFSDVAAHPTMANRIFSDLMTPPPPDLVHEFTPVDHVLNLLANDPSEIVVARESGEFAGLITPDSFVRWLGSTQAPVMELGLERIPANSRWHPYPQLSAQDKANVA